MASMEEFCDAATGSDRCVISTTSSFYWLVAFIVILPICFLAFYRLEIRGITSRHYAWFGLASLLSGILPFLAYLVTGSSWTGVTLSPDLKTRIEVKHVVVMFVWFGLVVFQCGSIVGRCYKMHARVGQLTLYAFLPLVLFELYTNALRVFVPEKPILLAQAVRELLPYHTNRPTTTILSTRQILLYSLPLLYSILVPFTMTIYGYASWKSLRQGKLKLHILYSTLLICGSVGPGNVRYYIQLVYWQSQCGRRHDDAVHSNDALISALIQTISQGYISLMSIPLVAILYATLPLETRLQNRLVRASFYYYMIHSSFSWLAAWALEVPSAIDCSDGGLLQHEIRRWSSNGGI
jgi:hypothetical protein